MKITIILAGMLLAGYCGFAQETVAWSCLSMQDAEKVVGQPVKLVESTSEKYDGIPTYLCTYVAQEIDARTKKLGNIYYMAEEYASAKLAHESLAKIVEMNKGTKKLTGIGDEAYSQTDGENFQLVMFRKGNKMVRMKINRITSFTGSIDRLHVVAKSMAARI